MNIKYSYTVTTNVLGADGLSNRAVMGKALSFQLPYPVSVNQYYMNSRGGRKFLSKRGREFQKAVRSTLNRTTPFFPEERLGMIVTVHPPTRRVMDIDNLWKSLLDSMEGQIFASDSQLDDERIIRGAIKPKDGLTDIFIWTLDGYKAPRLHRY